MQAWYANLPDPIVRMLRTFGQSFTGVILVSQAALMADANDGSVDVALWQRVVLAAAVAAVIAAVTLVHGLLSPAPNSGK